MSPRHVSTCMRSMRSVLQPRQLRGIGRDRRRRAPSSSLATHPSSNGSKQAAASMHCGQGNANIQRAAGGLHAERTDSAQREVSAHAVGNPAARRAANAQRTPATKQARPDRNHSQSLPILCGAVPLPHHRGQEIPRLSMSCQPDVVATSKKQQTPAESGRSN